MSTAPVAWKGRRSRQAFVEMAPTRTRPWSGPTALLWQRLLGRHVGRSPHHAPLAVSPDAAIASASNCLARPKWAILGVPSGVSSTLAGLRSGGGVAPVRVVHRPAPGFSTQRGAAGEDSGMSLSRCFKSPPSTYSSTR